MPVYWFALSQLIYKNWHHAVCIFIILHLLVYPASNGYNSYMDRDETSIGGLKNPAQPTRQLFYVTIFMDVIAVLLCALISIYFFTGIIAYILASRAYSNRKIRLKKYPIIGYLTVAIFQGAVTFFLVFHGSHPEKSLHVPIEGMVASSLLIGGFYPLTQIYQHEADLKDGVKTISYLLGYKGTFVFTAIIYFLAMMVLAHYFFMSLESKEFFVLVTCMLPVLVYFFIWAAKAWKDKAQANFENTMRMNMIAAVCMNIGFIVVLIMNEIS
ncbi:MAG: UbiA prenyltransferase family protein [Bacteroidetes bacterium]|nr:UbiA prenyltransferase family protein [Bacteroidota bacterium]MBS1972957.1 UbiA prenyltransferase family protein [Bacteroidota bacterium]